MLAHYDTTPLPGRPALLQCTGDGDLLTAGTRQHDGYDGIQSPVTSMIQGPESCLLAGQQLHYTHFFQVVANRIARLCETALVLIAKNKGIRIPGDLLSTTVSLVRPLRRACGWHSRASASPGTGASAQTARPCAKLLAGRALQNQLVSPMVVHVRDTRLRYELFSGSQPVPSYAHLSQPPPLSPYVHWCVGASGVLGELSKTLLLEGVKPGRQPELGFGRVSTSQPAKEKGVMITQCQCQCQCQSVNMPLYQVHNPILAQSFSHNFQGR